MANQTGIQVLKHAVAPVAALFQSDLEALGLDRWGRHFEPEPCSGSGKRSPRTSEVWKRREGWSSSCGCRLWCRDAPGGSLWITCFFPVPAISPAFTYVWIFSSPFHRSITSIPSSFFLPFTPSSSSLHPHHSLIPAPYLRHWISSFLLTPSSCSIPFTLQ